MAGSDPRNLPPSCKLVKNTLAQHGPLRWRKLRTETDLPRSTLNWALGRLESEGVIQHRPHHDRADEYELASTGGQ